MVRITINMLITEILASFTFKRQFILKNIVNLVQGVSFEEGEILVEKSREQALIAGLGLLIYPN